ncbi:MAG: sulfite exporter TauE/SafE family protein [Thermoleophilia bacterium]|nr:sulfite exporter TauE/SafE family protein [Thermoleophilia bacterium]
MTQIILLALVGLLGGAFGSMVGLGGGVFIVPALTLFLDVPVHSAIGASLVAVVATSTAGSITYVREELANLRLGTIIETSLTLGALTGGLVGSALGKEALSGIFGGVMVLVSIYMGLRRRTPSAAPAEQVDLGQLGSRYRDRDLDREVRYRVKRLPLGLFTGLVAGNVSGLLGVGGGFLTVPALRLGMEVPMRAAVATSSLMLGVTACAGAVVYFARGMVEPVVVVPVVLGVTVGALVGSRVALKLRSSVLTVILAVVLFALAVQMLLAAGGISLR